MNTTCEIELRKMLNASGFDNFDHDFFEEVCIVKLDNRYALKFGFAKGIVAQERPYLSLSIIDNERGCLDTTRIKFSDVLKHTAFLYVSGYSREICWKTDETGSSKLYAMDLEAIGNKIKNYVNLICGKF